MDHEPIGQVVEFLCTQEAEPSAANRREGTVEEKGARRLGKRKVRGCDKLVLHEGKKDLEHQP